MDQSSPRSGRSGEAKETAPRGSRPFTNEAEPFPWGEAEEARAPCNVHFPLASLQPWTRVADDPVAQGRQRRLPRPWTRVAEPLPRGEAKEAAQSTSERMFPRWGALRGTTSLTLS